MGTVVDQETDREKERLQEAITESLLVFYWGLYPSFTALYEGCGSQRVTNSNQYTSTTNRRPTTYYSTTLVQILLRALKSGKIRRKKKKYRTNQATKGRKIKRLNETKQIDSIRGDIHY